MGILKNRFKHMRNKDIKTMVLDQYRPLFTTTDGKVHIGKEYKYMDSNSFTCSIPEYLMIGIKDKGYMSDVYGIMYPLENIISIEWDMLDSKTVLYCERVIGIYNKDKVDELEKKLKEKCEQKNLS